MKAFNASVSITITRTPLDLHKMPRVKDRESCPRLHVHPHNNQFEMDATLGRPAPSSGTYKYLSRKRVTGTTMDAKPLVWLSDLRYPDLPFTGTESQYLRSFVRSKRKQRGNGTAERMDRAARHTGWHIYD